jgi:HSP20 family protein
LISKGKPKSFWIIVESDKIETKYENGILTVSIPKRDEAKPKPVRMIEIQ